MIDKDLMEMVANNGKKKYKKEQIRTLHFSSGYKIL